ncbi:MAG: ATP-binding protein [Spirochaetia bacterium]|nr:ATP-binding protein [Spirochaetia bacterium]
MAKNKQESGKKHILPNYLLSEITNIINATAEEIKKRTGYSDYGNWVWKGNGIRVNNGRSTLVDNEILNIGKEIEKYHTTLGQEIIKLGSGNVFNDASKQEIIRKQIQKFFDSSNKDIIEEQIVGEQNIDLPTWFNYQELCTKFIDAAIKQEGQSNNRIVEFVSTLRLRMRSFLNDKRMAIPLMLKDNEKDNKNVLAHFISFLLGDFNRYFKGDTKNSFIKQYNSDANPEQEDKTNQITIVDVSELPFEVLETVTALFGRLIIEFVSHFLPENRGKYPIVIVLEEAQNYISEKNDSVAKIVFERIAREGRKYGISLVVCSQRPSELSKTVLSQCNSFVIHRLQNPEDQKYIKGLVSSANADILDQLPIIPQQYAIITGDCVRTPIQVRIDDVDPTPNSHNPKYIENWLSDLNIPYEDTCKRWCNNENTK